MQRPQHLIIGTRGSKMALAQTNLVADALTAKNPHLKTTIKIITTKGDQDMTPIPLDTIGKAWFTSEIEDALLKGDIDLAVHSLKDLPPETPADLRVMAVMERSDPRDVLVARHKKTLAALPNGAVVGTDSLRRKALLLRQRQGLNIKSVRGNVETRLRKLNDGDYDALVLASAGLQRLDLLDAVTEFLDPTVFIPAVGQGVLAVEARADNTILWNMIQSIQHQATVRAVAAEQAFSRIIGGGCKLPIGCYVRFEKNTAYVSGMVGSMDASQCVVRSVSGPDTEVISLAEELARMLLNEPFMAR